MTIKGLFVCLWTCHYTGSSLWYRLYGVGVACSEFRSGTDTFSPNEGALIPRNQDCRWRKKTVNIESFNLKGRVLGPTWGLLARYYRLESRWHRTSETLCRSSADDSVSLTTTAFVTCMSGCCCLASCIAIARACVEKVIVFFRF